MFDDPKHDLKRLEKELLSQENEDWLDRELADARRLLDELENKEEIEVPASDGQTLHNRSAGSVGNTDRVDVDLDAYSDELLDAPPAKKAKGVRGLVVLIVLELLGIAALGAYWLIQLL